MTPLPVQSISHPKPAVEVGYILNIHIEVVIVNYRTAPLVAACLESLAPDCAAGNCRVRVVDNCSPDDSVVRLRSGVAANGWDNWVTIQPHEDNGGFAAGNNAALREILKRPQRPEYILLLNPDTVVQPRAIEQMLAFIQDHPDVGIVGPALIGADGRRECSAHRFPSAWNELDRAAGFGPVSRLLRRFSVSPPLRDEPHRCDWLSGACMLVRTKVLEQIGLLDEGFFLYFEEVDFCRRAYVAGWELWCLPGARVTHFEGQSTGINELQRRPSYWYASRRRYFAKALGVGGLAAADLLVCIGYLIYVCHRLCRLRSISAASGHVWRLLSGDLRALCGGHLLGLGEPRRG